MNKHRFEELRKDFDFANKELIDSIDQEQVKNDLQKLLDFFKKKQNLFQYAEFQLGLGRFLDFCLDIELLNQLKIKIDSAASLAWKIIQIYQNSCGQHEDGACVAGNISLKRVALSLNHVVQTTQWPDLPLADALSFIAPVQPLILPVGMKLYRIIDKKPCSRGHWWLENKPITKCQWRSDAAVLEAWNKGTHCVELTVNKELPVWRGKTAAQRIYFVNKSTSCIEAPNTNCYLKGGGIQVWLEPNDSVDVGNQKLWP